MGRTALLLGLMVVVGAVYSIGRADERAERGFGNFLDQQQVFTHLLVLDETLNQRITTIGNRVAQASDKPNWQYTFRIINDPLPNSFSLPAGGVYLHTGLLSLLDGPDEVAAVLAHDVAHISASHGVQRMYDAYRKLLLLPYLRRFSGLQLQCLLLGTAPRTMPPGAHDVGHMSTSHGVRRGHDAHRQQVAATYLEKFGGIMVGAPGGRLVLPHLAEEQREFGATLAEIVSHGYTEEQEFEADRLAIQYLQRADYDPYALVRLVKKLQHLSLVQHSLSKEGAAAPLSKHSAAFEERVRHVEEALAVPGKELAGRKAGPP